MDAAVVIRAAHTDATHARNARSTPKPHDVPPFDQNTIPITGRHTFAVA